jgi:hypothetical protein
MMTLMGRCGQAWAKALALLVANTAKTDAVKPMR